MTESALVVLCAIGLALLFNIASSLSKIAANLRSQSAGDEPREIQVVIAGSDDVVFFRIAGILKAEQREALRAHLVGGLGGGRRCFVLENGIHVDTVIRAPQVA